MMKVISIEGTSYSAGKLLVSLDTGHLSISLTSEENDKLLQLGTEIFISRQEALADEIKSAGPVLLTAEKPALRVYDPDDDIPL